MQHRDQGIIVKYSQYPNYIQHSDQSLINKTRKNLSKYKIEHNSH